MCCVIGTALHNLFYAMFACAYGFQWFSSVFHRFPLDHAIVSFKSLHEWNHHFYVVQAALQMWNDSADFICSCIFSDWNICGNFCYGDQLITLSPAWNLFTFLNCGY